MKGHFRASIVETGELQAVKSKTVLMPWLGWHYGRMKISKLVDEGTEVQIGDFLLELDNSSIVKYIREKEDELMLGQVELKRLQTKYHNAALQIKSRITAAKASYVL
ncbi:hypothetical protein GF337_12990, partial [candidate division KSB1 bacterium]|nr:hypothetical protein [candidate division KSB1 bacterium]